MAQYDEYVSEKHGVGQLQRPARSQGHRSSGCRLSEAPLPRLETDGGGVREFCVRPAVGLRQRVRDELHKMDPEYAAVEIGVG